MSEQLIPNELLAFIQHAIDTMDEISIVQICSSNYKEEEICRSKVLLYETLGQADRMPSRRRDEKGKRSLEDIISLLKVTDPDDVPTFVAKELHKLPPVTFDHVDVSRLLKDINTLKTSLAEVKFRLEASENTIGELRTELLTLKRNNSVSRSPEVSNVNIVRGAQNASVCSIASPPAVPPPAPRPAAPRNAPLEMSSSNTTSPPACAAARAPLAPPQRTKVKKQERGKTYAQASHGNPPRPDTVLPMKKVDEGGFTLVEKKKRRPRPARNQCGTASAATNLRVAEPMIAIYISRFSITTSNTEIGRYIKNTSQARVPGLDYSLVTLAKLESKRMTAFQSFVLQCPAKHRDIFLAPSFWPEGIVFRRYRGAIPKITV